MPATLNNTTTTTKYTDCSLGGDRGYAFGSLTIANNPVSILVRHGLGHGVFTETEYPYVTPTTLPLVASGDDQIVGVQIKSAIAASPAQVSGWLVEPNIAGIQPGAAFTSQVAASGSVTPGQSSVQVQKNGVLVGTEPIVDMIEGGGTGWTMADDAANTRVTVTPNDWPAMSAALTYSSTDGHTFVCTTSADLTGSVPLGARVKLTDVTVKYFIVTAIAAGSITLYGGTNYALSGGAITSPCYSTSKVPIGFNPDPSIWSETFSDALGRQINTAAAWVNPGTSTLAIPIGAWSVEYFVCVRAVQVLFTGNAEVLAYATLSTANNTESDADFTAFGALYANINGDTENVSAWLTKRKHLILTAKTSYFLNGKADAGAGAASVTFRGDKAKTIIRAVCAYL